jgi:hypothetical protein
MTGSFLAALFGRLAEARLAGARRVLAVSGARGRGILPNAAPMAPAVKTQEESA